MTFKGFQDCHRGAILDIGKERLYQFWISMSLWCLPSSFSSIEFRVIGDVVRRISKGPPWRPSWISERNNFSNFEFGKERLYQFWISVSLWCLPLSFSSIRLRVYVITQPGLDRKLKAHFVLFPDLGFGRCRLKNFKMAAMAAILDIGTERL